MRGPWLTVVVVVVVVVVGGAAACGSGEDSGNCGPGLTAQDGMCLVPPPLLVTSQGGSVLPAMEVWTAVWTGDESTGSIVNDFAGQVLGSPYYTAGLAEYGVGAGTSHGVLALGAPPASVNDATYDAAIGQLIGRTSSSGETFRLDANTVLIFVIPKATSEPVGTSYHTITENEFPLASGGSEFAPYIVLRQDSVGFVSDFDYFTWTATHELVETATDPSSPFAWLNLQLGILGEIADLCNDIPVELGLGGANYMVTRFYSAKLAAARLGDPCVPALATPYENIAVSPLSLAITSGQNQSGVVKLSAYSLGATTPMVWHVFVDTGFTATPSDGTINPGQSTNVTIRRTGMPEDPGILVLYVEDPSSPDSSIPRAESFAALTSK